MMIKDRSLVIAMDEESLKQHLEALSLIAGCSISHSDFGKIIKTSYSEVFDSQIPGPAESSVYEVEQTTERIISLMRHSPLLASGCESG